MSNMRPELSKKSKHYVEKHRYYELKNFCLQYGIWKKAYLALDGLSKRPEDLERLSKTNTYSNPTEQCAIARDKYSNWIGMVEQCCKDADPDIFEYLLRCVTEGTSYEVMSAKSYIPCCKDTFYKAYRRFFWLLSKRRD